MGSRNWGRKRSNRQICRFLIVRQKAESLFFTVGVKHKPNKTEAKKKEGKVI